MAGRRFGLAAGRVCPRLRPFAADSLRPAFGRNSELLPQERHLLVAELAVDSMSLAETPSPETSGLVDVVQALAAQSDLERRALLAAGGIDEADVRPRLAAGIARAASARHKDQPARPSTT